MVNTDGFGAYQPRTMTSITMDEAQVVITSASEMRASVDAHVERAVREHAQLAFRIAYAVLRNHHDAEDAVQETFLRVWRCSSKLKEIDDLKAWVARIAWRVAIDRRKVSREVAIPEGFEVPEVRRIEETAISHQMLAFLDRAMNGLPRKEREALLLASVEGMSMAEAAKVLGTSEGTVRARIFRARKSLRERMKKFMG
jgi:RNA polymerase sigma-70 factor (ECF subfamily)